MRFALRALVLAPAVLAAAAVVSTSAMAEETVKVPFTFTAAGKICPAGTYKVDRDLNHSVVTLRSVDATRTFSWLLQPGDEGPKGAKVVLKFDESGQSHALRSVRYEQLSTARLDRHSREAESASPMGQGR